MLTLRDVHSVRVLQEKLGTASRAMIVGNGGIALDLMFVCALSPLFHSEHAFLGQVQLKGF